MNTDEKLVLITGASRGLGRNMALQLAANGADLVITYRSKKNEAESVCKTVSEMGRKASSLQLDTSGISGFPSFSDKLGAVLREKWDREDIDFLVNNAGIDVYTTFGTTTEKQFDDLMNVHFKGVYFLTQSLLNRIADGGGIICVSSGLTRFAIPGYGAYASMKGAIEVLIKYLAKELGSRGIRANAIAPGAIETDFTKEALGREGIREFITSRTSLGRIGVPDDIGGLVVFLCSEEGRWVNAQRIEASGGMFL